MLIHNTNKVNTTNANAEEAFWTRQDARDAVLVTQDRLVAQPRIAAIRMVAKTPSSSTYDADTQISQGVKS
ncbi:hypothetical protein FRC01_009152 [Tulasnella sp. 417]|nr:hypothetical protein FRC01_009152 [Tulasnella sp. 417]